MTEIRSQLREWGRSLGVVIPKEVVIKEKLKAGETIEMIIRKKTNPVNKTFGTFKFKKITKEMLKESDEEAWDE